MINAAAAAEMLGVSKRSVYAWAESHRIPSHKFGLLLRFDRDELAEWIRNQHVPARIAE
jgi:excisionase family DNA binding protein